MVFPNNFQTENNVNALYNFADVISQTGYISLYLANTYANATISYVITPDSSFRSNASFIGVNATTYTFELTFNVPQIVNGIVYLDFVSKAYTSQSSTQTVKLYHVDLSATATQIGGDMVSPTITASGAGQLTAIQSMQSNSISYQNFGVGEKLRVTVLNSGTNSTFSCDPSNSDPYTDYTPNTHNTRFKINLPVKIDL